MKEMDEIPDDELSPSFAKPERIRELMKELLEDVVSDENPAEFAIKMGEPFGHVERRIYEPYGDLLSEFLIFIRRSDLPEVLRRGFGNYEAATLRTQDGPPTVNLHGSEALAEDEWSRMLPKRASFRNNLFGE